MKCVSPCDQGQRCSSWMQGGGNGGAVMHKSLRALCIGMKLPDNARYLHWCVFVSMTAIIESLGSDGPRDDAAFTWTHLLNLEAACCSALESHLQSLDPRDRAKSDTCAVTVLLLPRSALLLASVLACMRLQVTHASRISFVAL